MRSIGGWLLGMSLGVLLTCGSAQAQDTPKPIAIQVVIGADGSVQVIDAKTGKVLANVPKQAQAKPMTPKPDDARLRQEQAAKQLERALQQLREKQSEPAKPQPLIRKVEKAPLTPPPGWQVVPGTDPAKGIVLQKVKPGAAPAAVSVDQKLDLILKQLADLRRDVDGIKQKLGGAAPAVPMRPLLPGGAGKDNKPVIRNLQLQPIHGIDLPPGKKWAFVPMPTKADRVDELQKTIDRLRLQLEEAQRELKRLKDSPKK